MKVLEFFIQTCISPDLIMYVDWYVGLSLIISGIQHLLICKTCLEDLISKINIAKLLQKMKNRISGVPAPLLGRRLRWKVTLMNFAFLILFILLCFNFANVVLRDVLASNIKPSRKSVLDNRQNKQTKTYQNEKPSNLKVESNHM